MSKFLQRIFVCTALMALPFMAYADDFQVSNSNFEDWSGAAFDGEIQPKGWNACNVEQVGFKFNFAHRETGHNGGYCMMVQDQDVGAMGITETSPGYFSLGKPWAYVASITAINQATAGTSGGITWTHRPDSMAVWIKRTGSNTDKEDFYLLYYSWSGTAKGTKYKGKNGSCTTTGGYTDEESDVRQALNGNECGTNTMAKQIAEGMWREKKTYGNWTRMVVPIYYMNNDVPQKMNLIFSASNYPNFRANSGLYKGNSLYVDDVEMIYSSKIQKLLVDGKEWKGFDPNSTEVQTYSLGESATSIPTIEAVRGAGSITNARGTTVAFAGRTLSGSEISITYGNLTGTPTVITVKSEDGKSTTTYKIQFQKAASSNAKLAGITINGAALESFSPTKYNYEVELPYGTKSAPVVEVEKQEEQQTVAITQPTSATGTATIKVTAANKTATQTYTLNFKVGLLSDNELQDILVNGKSIPGYTPSQTVYKVSLPVSTTTMPTVTTVSKPEYGNDQTVVHTKPTVIDGGVYMLSVTTPGNKIAKVYKLNFKLEKSSYSYLKDLKVEGGYIAEFRPDNFTYYINLPMGTTSLPKITYTLGDEYQTVSVSELGAGVVDGTVRVTVTAGNGDQSVYKLVFSTEKSDLSTLAGITIGGVALPGFAPDVTSYTYQLPVGTTELPAIVPILGDQYQTYSITTAGLNGKTRITVTAGDGSTTIYMIAFSVEVFSANTLDSLSVTGFEINFDPEVNEYWVNLPQGTTVLPAVSYTLKDPTFQTASVRPISGLTGDYKITVRPQSGASRTYIIHFSVATSSNVNLNNIYVDGVALTGFQPDTTAYVITLPEGVSTIPTVTFEKAETSQRVLSVLEGKVHTITVTAQSGATRTYTVTFVVVASANAYLEMIYLNGDSLKGFDPKVLNYTVKLNGETCPEITVTKAPGQQVTITAPYGAGTAYIAVKPETGAVNTYTIAFEPIPVASAQLDGIAINGVAIPDFKSDSMDYTATYSKELPTITYTKRHVSQQIEVLWKDSVAWIHVEDTLGNKAAYSVAFSRTLLTVNTLDAIYADGVLIEGFDSNTKEYTYDLQPGSSYPELSYKVTDYATVVFFGQLIEGKWGIKVAAEDGTTTLYTVAYTILPYTDVTLKDLKVAGYDFAYDKTQNTYGPFTIAEGVELPVVTAVPEDGQSVLTYNENDSTQKVLVMAENGAKNEYTIEYKRVLSDHVQLANIVIAGYPDFAFNPAVHKYSVALPRDAKVVPNVNAVPQLDNQTVTTYFCRPDGVVRILVEAQDGSTGEYTIAFPLEKSDVTLLKSLTINGEAKDVNVTEYTFNVPFGTVEPYMVSYEQHEGQLVHLIEAPLTGTTKIIVTNEKGDNSRTYSINYIVGKPEGVNKVKSVKYSYVSASDATVTGTIEPVKGDNIIKLPFGTKEFKVDLSDVEKNYEAQTIQLYDGGIRRGVTIIAVANREGEDDVIYTLTPEMPEFEETGKLEHLVYKGAEVPRFRPDVYNYMINVTAQPKEEDFAGTVAYGGKTVTFSAFDAKKKQVTISVDGGETYNVCWFYNADEWPFTHTRVQTEKAYWYEVSTLGGIFGSQAKRKDIVDPTGYKPKGWKVPADLLAYIDYDATVSHFTYYTGHEVTVIGEKEITLSTLRGGALNSSMPGTLTLGGLSFPDGIKLNGNTKVSFEKNLTNAVQYRNTPEQFQFEYQPIMTVNGINNWNAWVSLGTASGTSLVSADISGTYANLGKWQTKTTNLSYNGTVGKLNIMLCASEVSGSSYNIYAGPAAKSADLQIRNMRMVYNSELTGVKVNGTDATKDGMNFIITVDDNYIGMPSLKFTGKVQDQTQSITLENNGEWIDGKLTAKVVNYGENANEALCDSTIYYVILQRTPVTSVEHTAAFGSYPTTVKGDTTFINMPYGTKVLPDLKITPESVHQLITMTKKGNAVTVNVKAEDGAEKTTVYVFREIKGTDATPETWNLESGVLNTVDAENHIYSVEAEKMPKVEISKKDGQLLDINYTVNGAVFTITSADGKSQTTYTINRLNPSVTTTGQIETFMKDGTPWAVLGGDTYDATLARPTELITFERKNDPDSVVYIQAPDRMEWQVYGSANHTYLLTYPSAASTNANLANILIDGVPYNEFAASETEYEIELDSIFFMDAVAAEMTQKIVTTQTTEAGTVVVYNTTVTAEDGTTTKQYRVTVHRSKSSNATLEGILLDGKPIDGFDPTVPNYTVTLPLPADGVKREQPIVPAITYIAGQKGQVVTVTDGVLNMSATELLVTSEDGSNNTYTVLVNAEPSHCADLTGITVNGEIVDQFEPGRHYYSQSIKTSKITIDYMADDRFQEVTMKVDTIRADHQLKYTLTVKAEDGVKVANYEVMIYIENQSNDAQLANILLNGKELDDFERLLNPDIVFDGGNNNYEITLPAGTTVLPEVSAKLKMDGQTVDIIQKADSVLLNVFAVDGTPNTYTLKFTVPLSTNANLSMIFLNGDSLKGFDPSYYFYQVDLPVGAHVLPSVAAQKSEAVQTILPIVVDSAKMQATIKIQAEDPTTRENTYVVVFRFTQSDADSLAMIYQDGKNLAGYVPTTMYYTLSLPVGTAAFPDLSWETVDEWQIVKMDTVESTADQLIRQITVTSESGKKNTYTVSYTILKSDIDTLQMIFVDQKALENFNASTLEYYYQLSASYAAELGGKVPTVEVITGDEYQTVLISQVRDSIAGKSLEYKSIVTVTAANGTTRTYTIHYPVEKSSEATLNMINLAGKPLAGYDAERFSYKVEIGLEAAVPAVTVIKKEEIQVVEISLVDDVITIIVTAEDGTQQTYTLTFVRVMSDIATLRDLILTDEQGEALTYPFRPEVFNYTINIPYSADKTLEEQLPAIEPVFYDEMQTMDTVHHLLENGDILIEITVTAPNGEDQKIYSLTFHFIKPSDAMLVNILIKGTELPNFLPQVTEYTYAHPYGSTTADYFTAADVQAMLSDRLATFTITESTDGTIYIRVVAQDGTTENTYAIMQTIAQDNDCLLSDIFIGEAKEALKDFDPEVTFYTFYLREGSTTTPAVEAVAHSVNATVDIREVAAGDTCTIFCTAADGTVKRYYIHFAISSVKEAIEATSSDVIIKRLPNSNTIFVGTIRKDVHFVLFDQNGHILFNKLVPPANPNDIVMTEDLETVERLSDIVNTRSGLTIDLNTEQIYFYTFLYGEKDFMQMVKGDQAKRLKSGKIVLIR